MLAEAGGCEESKEQVLGDHLDKSAGSSIASFRASLRLDPPDVSRRAMTGAYWNAIVFTPEMSNRLAAAETLARHGFINASRA